ncbi:MAG: hypothetical protein FJX59_19220 [Alphaproteobacteria bacterium]|nr:hypothetical protein [Alphaproteobacteria bacterium]
MAESKGKRQEYTTDFIKADIGNVSFLGNVHIDNIMTALIAMGAEIWTDRRRIRVLESLLEKKGVTRDMVEQYVPTAEEEATWKKEREVLVDRMYGQFARQGSEFNISSDWKNK